MVGGPVGQASEHKLKAAFLAQFIRYVSWPESRLGREDAPFVVGVLGDDPFGADLPKYIGALKGYRGHPIQIEYFNTTKGIEACHVLFVTRTNKWNPREILKRAAGKGVLLVGEEEHFASQGGVINFYWKSKSHIGFEINLGAAKRQQLDISSQLLKLARIVKDKP